MKFEHKPECPISRTLPPGLQVCLCGASQRSADWEAGWRAAIEAAAFVVTDWDVAPSQLQLVTRIRKLEPK